MPVSSKSIGNNVLNTAMDVEELKDDSSDNIPLEKKSCGFVLLLFIHLDNFLLKR